MRAATRRHNKATCGILLGSLVHCRFDRQLCFFLHRYPSVAIEQGGDSKQSGSRGPIKYLTAASLLEQHEKHQQQQHHEAQRMHSSPCTAETSFGRLSCNALKRLEIPPGNRSKSIAFFGVPSTELGTPKSRSWRPTVTEPQSLGESSSFLLFLPATRLSRLTRVIIISFFEFINGGSIYLSEPPRL